MKTEKNKYFCTAFKEIEPRFDLFKMYPPSREGLNARIPKHLKTYKQIDGGDDSPLLL